jgi:hypothetical protein
MPLRGMGRIIFIPGVSLRSTPGYSRLAAPRHPGEKRCHYWRESKIQWSLTPFLPRLFCPVPLQLKAGTLVATATTID